MFGIFKKIFSSGRSKEADVPTPAATPATVYKPAVPPAKAATPPAASPSQPTPTVPDEAIALPLKPIVSRLPQALQANIAKHPADGVSIRIPLKTVKDQLARGSVKITFGELRKSAPPGVFNDSNLQDQTSVELPLQEILSQLKPAQITRRTDQKKVDVPPEVLPLFGPKGEPLSPVPKPGAASAPAPSPTVQYAGPAPAPTTPKSAEPATKPSPLPQAAPAIEPSPSAFAPTPTPVAKALESTAPIPFQPLQPSITIPKPPEPALPVSLAPTAPPSPPPAPITMTSPPPPEVQEKIPFKLPVEKPAVAAPSPPNQPSAPALSTSALAQLVIAEAGVFAVKIESFVANWPEPVQQEIQRLNLAHTTMAFPVNEIEQAVKRGKVAFTWKQIRASLRPSAPAGASAQDEFHLELPLSAIVPLFLAQRRQDTSRRKKVEVADNIPHLFARTTAGPVTAEPIPTPTAPAPPAAVEAAPPPEPDFGQIFGQPDKKSWTPMEIVQKTATLSGVAGAAIALQEGLQVASQLPPELSSETFAAFLPQMFGRMSQYTKEMNLGEPSQLNLVANNVPVQIFKVGKVYFTVLGRAGQPLPMSQLIAVAAQLGRQSK